MTVREIVDCITEIAPLQWQEDYDNAGIQVGDLNAETHKVLIALDVTEEVVDEAVAKSCDLIVSHHPLIFSGLKHLTPATAQERTVIKAVKHDISIVSMHTNLDNCHLGVSRVLAERLGLRNLRLLQPSQADPECCGAGMVGEFKTPMEETDFLALVADCLDTPCVRHSNLTGRKIVTVGLCGGSGSPFIHDALVHHVDAYLTADIKYHTFFAPDNILLVDGGHFETEQFTKQLIKDLIQKKFPTFAAEIAETNTNSVHYFCKR
ncbi:MAG: Nif3-like dinuclear metal center hexameric protein [Bacteroidales bacterium]|nr:Nif3-like dinuclear metal center hexameric protein [Bacteroidales bacterium]